jgi:hypothetical protein
VKTFSEKQEPAILLHRGCTEKKSTETFRANRCAENPDNHVNPVKLALRAKIIFSGFTGLGMIYTIILIIM